MANPRATEPRHRVWILGAGFSYPLGAPLFGDLFGKAYTKLARSMLGRFKDADGFDREKRTHFRDVAIKIYQYGKENDYWEDPEQFLQRATDCLKAGAESAMWDWLRDRCGASGDIPAQNSALRDWHTRVSREKTSDFVIHALDAAREEIATEVSLFLAGADFQSERWRPYRAWLESLGPRDIVISFNYDEALEKLAASPACRKGIHCPKPNAAILDRRLPTLFKLHGSAGWKAKKPDSADGSLDIGKAEIESCECPLDFLGDYSYRPLIYTPGPEKMAFAQWGDYWRLAMDCICEAEEIHVIGYRFPDTDTFAQHKILSAIADNERCHYVNIVLGPDVNDPKSRRSKRLIYSVGKAGRPVEMFSQDYLRAAVESSRDSDTMFDFSRPSNRDVAFPPGELRAFPRRIGG